MRRLVVTIACLLALPVATQAATAAQASAARTEAAPGCYDVNVGPWYALPAAPGATFRAPPDGSSDSLDYATPVRVELSHEPATGFGYGPEHNTLTVPANTLQTPHAYRYWHTEDGRLRLHLGTLHAGVSGTFEPDGTGWRGRIRDFIDVFPTQEYERTATLVPVACESPPPIPATADPPLPRVVALAMGERIELGRALPDAVGRVDMEPRGTGRLGVVLAGPIEGPFAGATGLNVQLGAGDVVQRIHVLFADAEAQDEAIRRIEREVGRAGPRWANRTTSIGSSPATGQVSLIDPRVPTWTPR